MKRHKDSGTIQVTIGRPSDNQDSLQVSFSYIGRVSIGTYVLGEPQLSAMSPNLASDAMSSDIAAVNPLDPPGPSA